MSVVRKGDPFFFFFALLLGGLSLFCSIYFSC